MAEVALNRGYGSINHKEQKQLKAQADACARKVVNSTNKVVLKTDIIARHELKTRVREWGSGS
ncbi:hypothetical protein [Pontibacter akesuensis]|uniref:hypothetical protein n=1 Tax=Pontibacter akesuensis TaxID=388950 RepID=UPI000942AB0A|nr:hypothetical protein [Pontibacter akesuensis]